ncbi:MAG: 30S ribosomal protein S6 [Bacillota bacterium]
MRKYEVLYIMKPDLLEEKYQENIEKYNALIQANGGEILNTDIWGKRRLAYEIDKIREGYYVLLQIQCDTELTKELERHFRISEDVIRYLVTRIEE